ncbi:aldehyde-activating protein [Reinekea sp.]|jgi:hypothetical protein|uniref:GFA family protein n=1 Tax=Reinekea sp. TaxID=1970455 RepID=UPI002A838A8F|nr:aldehyde-activating protein [Reinekea sp.]
MLSGQCHCANVSFETDQLPSILIECNCSICVRYGARWAHFAPDQVRVRVRHGSSVTYSRGERSIDFHHCPDCGCVTHYSTTNKADPRVARVSINARMCPTEQVAEIPIRHFDGAESFAFLD